MKELKIEAPQGYEIDKENSTFECIKFKKKQEIKTWDDLCKCGVFNGVGSYISYNGHIDTIDLDGSFSNNERGIFLTKKEAKSARAAAMISQLMPYYGGAITYEEWGNNVVCKYYIYRSGNELFVNYTRYNYSYLAFRTEEDRDRFLKHNEQLVKEYLMLD